jgi:hypothetical protein
VARLCAKAEARSMKTVILNLLLLLTIGWLGKLGNLDLCRSDVGQLFIPPATVILLISISCRIDTFA